MIVPNKGEKVAIMRIGKFTLYSIIAKVNTYIETTKTWEVEIWNGSKGRSDLKFNHVIETDYHFDTIPVTLIAKSYAGNDWEIAEGQK